MRRITVLLLALMLMHLGLAAQGRTKRGIDRLRFPETRSFSLPQIIPAEMENGIRIRLIHNDKLPLFRVSIMFKGGTAYQPKEKIGMTDILAEVLRVGGTADKNPAEVDRLLESRALNLSISSTADYFRVDLSGLIEDFDFALGLLAELLQSPAYDQEKLDEIKTRMGSAISRRNDEPMPIAQREFQRLLYGGDFPLTAVMEYAHLDLISRQDLRQAHELFFQPDNMLAGVSGPFKPEQVSAAFERHFATWQGKAKLPAYPVLEKKEQDFRLAFAEKADLNQSYILLGHLDQAWNEEENAKIAVFNTIFSQGMDSRLFNRVRTKEGLTYGVGGGIDRKYLYPGAVGFFTFTKNESAFRAVRAMFEEMEEIRARPVSSQELQDAKEFLLNSHVFKFATPDRVLERALQQEFYQLPAGLDERTVEMVKAVTLADIQDVARKYLHPDKMLIFILGREADLDGKLEEWGRVKKIDIAIPPPPLKESFPEPTEATLQQGEKLLTRLAAGPYRRMLDLKALRLVMEMKITTPQGELTMNMVDSSRYPHDRHQTMEIMGMKMERVTTEQGGYISQMGQKRAVSAEEIRQESFGGLRGLLKEPGKYQVQYLDQAEIEGEQVDILLIREKEGSRWKKMAFARKSGFLLMEESMQEVMGAGQKPARTYHRDIRIVSGMPQAHLILVQVDGKTMMESKISRVEVNPQLPDDLFKID